MTDIPVRDVFEATTTRLISTAYMDAPLAPLADEADDLAFLDALAGLSSSELGVPDFIPAGVHPGELLNAHHGSGWTYVNAAFCYTRVTGNRFNGPERGAWYATWGADQVETAQAEVSWHLGRELEATGVFDNTSSYCALNASFATSLHDLTGPGHEAVLHADPTQGYQAGQALAAALWAQGGNGVIYPSVRRAGGQCLAAFRPHLVQNVRQGATWVFTWSGDAVPVITQAP